MVVKHSSSGSPVKLEKVALIEIMFWRAQKEKTNKTNKQKMDVHHNPLVIRNTVFIYLKPLKVTTNQLLLSQKCPEENKINFSATIAQFMHQIKT